ncbi:hypothetical protein [Sphingomonas sp.]|uniref:hypothetical protein n=1 Tax=Sphingomonas sp. TaxID=28214 RepID=UPI003B0093D7
MPRRLAPALLLFAAACGRTAETGNDIDRLDRELTNDTRDPAIAEAVAGQIMVDPTLQQSSNANAVRPPPRPDSGAVPADVPRADPIDPRSLRHAPAATPGCPQCAAKASSYTLGALAAAQPHGCAVVNYSAAWATRLPADLPLYPDARVVEAAGNDAGPCRLRVVTFRSGAAAGKLIDWYYTHAIAGRYSAEHRVGGGMEVLGGTRGDDAYVVYVTPRAGGGADVDLVTNAGS